MKSAVYQVEMVHEPTGDLVNFEHIVDLPDDADETDVLNQAIYTSVLDAISINVDFLYLEA